MIDHLGLSRMAVLLVVALIIFGPEKLPEIASQLGKAIRKFRGTLDAMGSELRASVGPEMAELDLASLHPKRFMADLMSDDDTGAPAAPTAPTASDPLPGEQSLPTGSDAMALLNSPLDLSSVDEELLARGREHAEA